MTDTPFDTPSSRLAVLTNSSSAYMVVLAKQGVIPYRLTAQGYFMFQAKLLSQMPEVASAARNVIGSGFKALADQGAVSAAREALRLLLVDGTIVLTPNPAHTSMVGEVKFVDLGGHLLQLAGVRRRARFMAESPTPTIEAASESQANQATVTMVAGAGFEPATFGL